MDWRSGGHGPPYEKGAGRLPVRRRSFLPRWLLDQRHVLGLQPLLTLYHAELDLLSFL